MQLQRGAYGIGAGVEAPAPPTAGIGAELKLARLDLDAWRALSAPEAGAGQAAADPLASPLWPSRIALQATELRLGGRSLDAVSVVLQRRAVSGGHPLARRRQRQPGRRLDRMAAAA